MRYPLLLLLLLLSWLIPSVASAQSAHTKYGDRTNPSNVITAQLPHIVGMGKVWGVAGGIGYERFIGDDGRLSLQLPVYAAIMGGNILNEQDRRNSKYQETTAYYAAPGISYHPFGNGAGPDVSLGVQLLAGKIQVSQRDYDSKSVSYITQQSDHLLAAALGSIGVNFNSDKVHRIFGLYGGAGIIIDAGPLNGLFAQFGIRFGSRF